MTKQEQEEILKEGKQVWDLIHQVGGSALTNIAGKKYILLQGALGDTIIDAATGDTLDEMLIGLAGDIFLGGFIFKSLKGITSIVVPASLIGADIGPGSFLKETYKAIKYPVTGFFWDYVTNFDPTTTYTGFDNNILDPLQYAKVQAYVDENGVIQHKTSPTGATYISIDKDEYDTFMANKEKELNELEDQNFNTKIENIDGVFKMTMPTGEIIAEGDVTSNTIIGANKEDYLLGNGGVDTLIGNSGNDYLDGGTGSDTLIGEITPQGLNIHF